MSTLINNLKSEIARVARKELKAELLSLRKATTVQRSEIAALKRQVKTLVSGLKALSKANRTAKPEVTEESEQKTSKIRFSPGRLTSVREKLGVTKAEFAQLVGASYLTVHKWETSQAQPREKQLQKIAAVAKLGKREVRKHLATEAAV